MKDILIYPPNNFQPQCINITSLGKGVGFRNLFSKDSLYRIQTIYAENLNIKELGNFNKLINLEEIFVPYNQIRRLDPYLFVDNKKLRNVFLNHNKIRIPRSRPLLVSASIDTIDLSNNGFRKLYPNTFEKLPKLRILYLQGNLLSVFSINTFSTMNNLKFLNLDENPLKIYNFKRPKNLRYIFLPKNNNFDIDL